MAELTWIMQLTATKAIPDTILQCLKFAFRILFRCWELARPLADYDYLLPDALWLDRVQESDHIAVQIGTKFAGRSPGH
jgi:hypothetical protein